MSSSLLACSHLSQNRMSICGVSNCFRISSLRRRRIWLWCHTQHTSSHSSTHSSTTLSHPTKTPSSNGSILEKCDTFALGGKENKRRTDSQSKRRVYASQVGLYLLFGWKGVSGLHISAGINLFGECRNVYNETFLNFVENFRVLFGGNKGNGKSLRTKAACTTNLCKKKG
jgi:hypothetical protein